MPQVFNKHFDLIPPDAIYVGRPSKWGNPWSHLNGTKAQFKTDTVFQAIGQYELYIKSHPHLMSALWELKGKDLVCWCSSPTKPRPCHAHVLVRLANETSISRL